MHVRFDDSDGEEGRSSPQPAASTSSCGGGVASLARLAVSGSYRVDFVDGGDCYVYDVVQSAVPAAVGGGVALAASLSNWRVKVKAADIPSSPGRFTPSHPLSIFTPSGLIHSSHGVPTHACESEPAVPITAKYATI